MLSLFPFLSIRISALAGSRLHTNLGHSDNVTQNLLHVSYTAGSHNFPTGQVSPRRPRKRARHPQDTSKMGKLC